MVTWLAKWLIKDHQNTQSPRVRQAYGMLCGGLGIVLNVILFGIKMFAGTISGSIAITADAFNNLSDAGSSVITLVGFKMAGQKPDIDHPFGHGRIEYIAGLVVSFIILLMGFELAQSSVQKILQPETVVFSPVSVVIMVISIGIKLYMAFFNNAVGKKLDAPAMRATAADSLSDSVSTTFVLLAMLVGKWTGLQIDGWCGALVALFILYAGIRSAKETIDPLLGQPPEAEFVQKIKDIVVSYPEVVGIHDLVVHDYGPGRRMISLHAEVPAEEDILLMHDAIDNIEHRLRNELGCEAVIHMDPVVTDDPETMQLRDQVEAIVSQLDEGISMHDFRMVTGPTHTNLIFDVVVPYGYRLADAEVESYIRGKVLELNERYFAVVQIDKALVR